MTTQKLYLQDMYATTTDATITEIIGNTVVVDQTVFFAEGGGQVGDTGLLNDYRVVDTQKKVGPDTKMLLHESFPSIRLNTNNAHILEVEPNGLQVGDKVSLKIDWERRYRIMRNHSATHIVLLVINRLIGELPVKGCLLESEKGRIDFGSKISPDQIPEIEKKCNDLIQRGLPIENSMLENEPEALFWKCDGEVMPCGGTHVANTSEIGPIKLKRRSQGKKLDRIYIEVVD